MKHLGSVGYNSDLPEIMFTWVDIGVLNQVMDELEDPVGMPVLRVDRLIIDAVEADGGMYSL